MDISKRAEVLEEGKKLQLKQLVNEIETRFTYHQPKAGQPEKYQLIRDCARSMAMLIAGSVPESREQALALTALEECVMWANAGIARRE